MVPFMRFRALSLLLLLVLAGCSRVDYRVVREGGWNGAVPAPRGPVILTVVTPEGSYRLDRAALEKLTWVERKTLFHPEEKLGTVGVFQGVLLADLLRELGYPDPGRVRFEALDGYRITVDWERIAPFHPMLALDQDRRPLPERYGPVRVIFPYKRLKPDPVAYNAYWVWQLTRLVVSP